MSFKDAVQTRAKKGEQAKLDGEKVKATLARAPTREEDRWSFGFRFFREIENFGLDSGKVDKKWTLSVIYRLGELSALKVAEVMESPTYRDSTLRIHDIDWSAKNIPIKRSDLNWLSAEYLNNPEEFPIFQFAVSRAEGRLIGFLDEDNVFQVVLLDPLHNAQPAKINDYKVRMCKPLGCEITSVKYEANQAIGRLKDKDCGCASEFEKALSWNKTRPGVAIVIPIVDGTDIADADEVIRDGYAKSYAEIFSAGLVAVVSQPSTTQPAQSASPAPESTVGSGSS